MEKMRILIVENTASSRKAFEMLKKRRIEFTEIHVEDLTQVNFHIPLLLAPEGKFEGLDLVQIYANAELNGFHKKLEKPITPFTK